MEHRVDVDRNETGKNENPSRLKKPARIWAGELVEMECKNENKYLRLSILRG